MKIYSWNMLCKNQDPDEVLFFIENTNFDIFALQEVPEHILPKINSLGFDLAFSVDHSRIHEDETENCYLAIISKHKILKSGSEIISEEPKLSPQTKLFLGAERVIYKTMGINETPSETKNHRFLWADIEINNKKVRFFSCHLEHGGPKRRLSNFKEVEKHMRQEGSVICGDFNTIYNPFLNIYNWIRGSKIKEALPFSNERKIIKKKFSELNLKNPLAYKITHIFFPSQLDHILVPKEMRVKNAEVLSESHGSDHYPVFVEITL